MVQGAPTREVGPVELAPQMTVGELAESLGVAAVDVIKGLLKEGIFANINQTLNYKVAETVATDMGYEVSELPQSALARPAGLRLKADEGALRPPVVTVMGHVDHGKTSLLDAIRQTNVTAREAGGITQHIAAYQVEVEGQKITFLDTPGHEAFTAMRARGAHVTDIAVIVVAADDGVMPQTIEALDHARAAGVPIIIAINKIDRPDADQEKVKRQLAEQNVLVEEWGGDTVCVAVSARTKEGLPDLLEHILLVAELEELKADPDRKAEGIVVEAHLDPQRGAMADVLVQTGTLRLGDVVVAAESTGRLKAMYDDRNRHVTRAEPAMPVKILGLGSVPQPGDRLTVVADEKAARSIVEERVRQRQQEGRAAAVSLTNLFDRIQTGQIKELSVVLKADVQGSVEPIRSSLQKLEGDNVRVKVLRAQAGSITESDVMLALASGGLVIGFNSRPEPGARRLADLEKVEIRTYDVIYKLVEDIEAALKGLLEPTFVDVVEGHAAVRQVFKLSRRGTIAGCAVTDGRALRAAQVRVLRAGEKIAEDRVAGLKRFKDDVREVATNMECGVALEAFQEFAEGDVLEFYRRERQG